jgi:hypothetical protein
VAIGVVRSLSVMISYVQEAEKGVRYRETVNSINCFPEATNRSTGS